MIREQDPMKSWKGTVGIAFLALAALAGVYAFIKLVSPFGLEPWMVKEWTKEWTLNAFYHPVVKLVQSTILTPVFLIVLGLTLSMELFFPAEPRGKMFGVSFYQDLVWFFYETVLQAIVTISYIYWLNKIYYAHFSFLTIEAVAGWPGWARFMIGVILLDFLYWLQHYLNHKVPWF